ncbi:AraC family transcriptional regulator [Vibrio rotiferianus]|uniref:AraC family transcriptional regulator n=1 Tax=Vibrio rotiferianus TaxID=190895 RepID=UPI00406A2503
MNYAIEFHNESYSLLTTTARKKTLKHSLLTVVEGLATIRLGKHEYAIEPGNSFWIPQGCLSSITYFPNCIAVRCDFSVRLRDHFSSQAGFIERSLLLQASLEKLRACDVGTSLHNDLLRIIKHEVLDVEPKLITSKASEALMQWTPMSKNHALKELHLALLVREARKRTLSGIKKGRVVEDLFDGSEQQCDQLSELLLGKKL